MLEGYRTSWNEWTRWSEDLDFTLSSERKSAPQLVWNTKPDERPLARLDKDGHVKFINDDEINIIKNDYHETLNKYMEDMILRHNRYDRVLIPNADKITASYGIRMPEVKKITHSGPCTIVFWKDNTKTIVRKEEGIDYDPYAAFTAALAKKIYGSNSKVHKILETKTVESKPKKKKKESADE